jgi:sec-independent protein translocase protein TatB
MFDIGFFEICLTGVIALLVIGPEKLPRVARTVGLWLGKARGMVKTVKYEIDNQVRAEELKESIEKARSTLHSSVSEPIDDIEAQFDNLQNDIQGTTESSDAEKQGQKTESPSK